jgi:hypothetical protein
MRILQLTPVTGNYSSPAYRYRKKRIALKPHRHKMLIVKEKNQFRQPTNRATFKFQELTPKTNKIRNPKSESRNKSE